MEKLALVVLFCCLIVCSVWTQSHAEEWHRQEKIWRRKDKVARLHFYFHDVVSGKTPTTVMIAQAPTTETSPTLFGGLWMADNPLTVGPEPTSEVIGRSQGLHGAAGQQEQAVLFVINFVFTSGIYNGSSLSVLGRTPVLEKVRDTPVVGGTGVFRFARGIATSKTYFANATTHDAIIEFDVTVVY